jgi:hypothetical protein
MITQTQITEISAELMELSRTRFSSLDELEVLAGQKTRQVIRGIITQWLNACEEIEPQPQTRCRECGLLANFISRKAACARTQFGLVRYQRAYYVCPHCHASTCPLDERLNPLESLARLREKIAAGKSLPIAEMAKVWGLGSLSGMTKSHVSLKQESLLNIRSSSKEPASQHQVNAQVGFFPIF